MPWIIQIAGMALLLFGVLVALSISAWILLFFLVLGVAGVVWEHLRDFFVEQGILNPKYGTRNAEEDAPHITIVEGDFERVEPEAEKLPQTKE